MASGSDKPTRPSLIERAAEVYDFSVALRRHQPPPQPVTPAAPQHTSPAFDDDPAASEMYRAAAEAGIGFRPIGAVGAPAEAARAPQPLRRAHPIDRSRLDAAGFVDPFGAPTALSEEFRIIKRQVLNQIEGGDGSPRDRLVLIGSAHPGDGKTWIALNLALSLAAEKDSEVLLVDGDFGKPGLCQQLGLSPVPGLMEALIDPAQDLADLIVPTDLPALSLLAPGRSVNNDTELLASDRTRALLHGLVAANPRRIVLIDSPPALAASAASELARHVGMVLMVVRADRTSEAALRDAVQLLAACPRVQAVLNGVKFSSSGRRFGAYYGKVR